MTRWGIDQYDISGARDLNHDREAPPIPGQRATFQFSGEWRPIPPPYPHMRPGVRLMALTSVRGEPHERIVTEVISNRWVDGQARLTVRSRPATKADGPRTGGQRRMLAAMRRRMSGPAPLAIDGRAYRRRTKPGPPQRRRTRPRPDRRPPRHPRLPRRRR